VLNVKKSNSDFRQTQSPISAEQKFNDVVKSAQTVTVLVLVY
jgi:hypothetical protein